MTDQIPTTQHRQAPFLAVVTIGVLAAVWSDVAFAERSPSASAETFRRRAGQPSRPFREAQRPLRITRPTESADSPDPRDPTNAGSSFSTVIASLVFVVALILLLGMVVKRHRPAGLGGLPDSVVTSLGRTRIDARHSVHLVRCGSSILVLGVSSEGVRTLSEITDPIEVDRLTGLCQRRERTPNGAPSFADKFRNWSHSQTDSRPRQPQPPTHALEESHA